METLPANCELPSSRGSLSRLGLTLTLTALFSVCGIAPAALSQGPIRPLLDYVLANEDGTATAVFGYLSPLESTQTIPVGSQNFFSPNPINRGQPTVFHPGRHFHVLQVTFSESQIFWILNGNTARARLEDAVIPQNLFDLGDNDGLPHFVLAESGNVGIGVQIPMERLSVDGRIQTTGGIIYPDGSFQQTASGAAAWQFNGPDIYFLAGRTGIGSMNPQAQLHVSHVPVSLDAQWGIRLQNAAQANFQGGLRISNDGFLDITNNALAENPGFARLNTAGTWTEVSDARVKRDITLATGLLERSLALNPVYYRFNDRPDDPLEIGLIAQEVQQVLSELVTEGDLLTIDYARLSVVLLAALKEQQAILEKQNAHLSHQDARIAALEKLLHHAEVHRAAAVGRDP